jgi:hypothetical protein
MALADHARRITSTHDNITPVRASAIDYNEVAHPLDDLTPLAVEHQNVYPMTLFPCMHRLLTCTPFCPQHTIPFRFVSSHYLILSLSLFHPPSCMRLNSLIRLVIASSHHLLMPLDHGSLFIRLCLVDCTRTLGGSTSSCRAQLHNLTQTFALACQPSQFYIQFQTWHYILIMNLLLSNVIASRCSSV